MDQPSWFDPPATIVEFYADAEFSATFVTGIAMVTLAYVLLVVFLCEIAQILGDGHGSGSTWIGYMVVGGAVLDAALVAGYLATLVTATFWASHGGLSVDGYLVLHGLSFSFYWLDLIVSTLWIASFGAGILRSKRFPLWLGWALVLTAFGLVASFFVSSTDVWDAVSGLPYLWVLIAAILLLLRINRYAEPA